MELAVPVPRGVRHVARCCVRVAPERLGVLRLAEEAHRALERTEQLLVDRLPEKEARSLARDLVVDAYALRFIQEVVPGAPGL